MIFLKSQKYWYAVEVGLIMSAYTNRPPTSFRENETARPVMNTITSMKT